MREDARRRGIFSVIFDTIRREASADPAVIGVRLYVEADNTRALTTKQDANSRAIGLRYTALAGGDGGGGTCADAA